MRSSTYSLNENYGDLVSGFDESTCSGDSFYEFFENEDKIITEYLNVWVNTNKKFGKGGSLKFLTVTCQSITIIWKLYGLLQKRKTWFWLENSPGNTRKG